MNKLKNKVTYKIAAVVIGVIMMMGNVSTATACTGMRLVAGDGAVLYGRSMEFANDFKSDIIIIPRGKQYTGTAPEGMQGVQWKTRYGIITTTVYGMEHAVDGFNEKGLAAGMFMFTQFAQYADVDAKTASSSLGSWEYVTWLLSNFATVEEVREHANDVKVSTVKFKMWGIAPELHFVVHDASGKSLVLEPRGGKMVIYDNPLGVLTNGPTFDWHIQNLANYVNLKYLDANPFEVSGVKVTPAGRGSGLLGLPGDYTPVSRFVRAATFTASTLTVPDQIATVDLATMQMWRFLSAFTMSKGFMRLETGGRVEYNHSQWELVSDLKNRKLMFRTYDNPQIRVVDLNAFDLDAPKVKRVSMGQSWSMNDVSDTAQ